MAFLRIESLYLFSLATDGTVSGRSVYSVSCTHDASSGVSTVLTLEFKLLFCLPWAVFPVLMCRIHKEASEAIRVEVNRDMRVTNCVCAVSLGCRVITRCSVEGF